MTLWLVTAYGAALTVSSAEAQVAFRGFADAGSTTFAATKSFKATLGSETGVVYGGGVEAIRKNVFLNLRASRFQKTGERVFVFEGREFPLGIPETITVTPIELTAGYRFDVGSWIVPYAGIGAGWHKLTDTSKFATAGEDVKKTYSGYQIVGGGEFRLAEWLGLAAEAQWSRVPNALGQDENSVSKMYSETDLGGSTFRVKVVIGQ